MERGPTQFAFLPEALRAAERIRTGLELSGAYFAELADAWIQRCEDVIEDELAVMDVEEMGSAGR